MISPPLICNLYFFPKLGPDDSKVIIAESNRLFSSRLDWSLMSNSFEITALATISPCSSDYPTSLLLPLLH